MLTLPELIRQLGIARFGHSPVVGDPFVGGGSIPFEAARLGCGVVASDLNLVAVMLSRGALNDIGGAPETRTRVAQEQHRVARAVDVHQILAACRAGGEVGDGILTKSRQGLEDSLPASPPSD